MRAELASTLARLGPPTERVPEFADLGLKIAEIERACAAYRLEQTAQRIGGRGRSAPQLHRIAWHGSALADIGCPAGHPARSGVLIDAALFNLAVALTDSLVDDEPSIGARVAGELDPRRLARRLDAPADPSAAIRGTDASLAGFYELWDAVLSRLGERIAPDPRARARLAGMLERMHHSEFGLSADRLPAKVLPIEFVGAIIDSAGEDEELGALYRELGGLVGLSDDWHDLAADMRHMHANQLLRTDMRGVADRGRYLAVCLRRIVFSRGLPEQVARELGQRIARVLERAAALSPEAQARAASYLKGLLQC